MNKNQRENRHWKKRSSSGWWRRHSRRMALVSGAGALALIVVTVAGVIAYRARHRPITISSGNTNTNGDVRSSSALSSKEVSFAYDDDKHKLFQAAGITKDRALALAVLKKLGFLKTDGTVTEDYPKFVDEHFTWAKKNQQFIESVKNVKDARTYVKTHL